MLIQLTIFDSRLSLQPLQLSDRPEEFHNMLDNITHNYLVKSH